MALLSISKFECWWNSPSSAWWSTRQGNVEQLEFPGLSNVVRKMTKVHGMETTKINQVGTQIMFLYSSRAPTTMTTRRRIRDMIDATRDHLSTMSGRYRISPVDFDQLYQLYQEDTSAKGLYEFIIDHPITHSIAARLNIRPIDVLAAMVGKTADACQQELKNEIEAYEAAEKKAAGAREKTKCRG